MRTPPAGPPAAWYDNPTGDGLRYWDGAAWTDHVARERVAEPAPSTPPTAPPSGDGGHVPWRGVASSTTARVMIDLAMVVVLALVIVVGIATTHHQAQAPTPIVEAAGGSSTTSAPTSTTEVPTTQAVPTTVPPTTVPPTTVPPTPSTDDRAADDRAADDRSRHRAPNDDPAGTEARSAADVAHREQRRERGDVPVRGPFQRGGMGRAVDV